VAVILRNAIEEALRDIHIEYTGEKVKVRFRVDGTLHTTIVLPPNVYSGIVARIKILSKLRLDEKRKPQDGSFSANIDGRKIDFRVSTMPGIMARKSSCVFWIPRRGVKPLDQLGLSETNLKYSSERPIKRPYGLILITGPTGSGNQPPCIQWWMSWIKKKAYRIAGRSSGVSHAGHQSVANDAGDWIHLCLQDLFNSASGPDIYWLEKSAIRNSSTCHSGGFDRTPGGFPPWHTQFCHRARFPVGWYGSWSLFNSSDSDCFYGATSS